MQKLQSDDPAIWEDMRQRLMKLTTKQLKQLAKDEGICLGYDASRKDSMVGNIVSSRRHRCIELDADPATHPWRKWNSVNNMAVRSDGYGNG